MGRGGPQPAYQVRPGDIQLEEAAASDMEDPEANPYESTAHNRLPQRTNNDIINNDEDDGEKLAVDVELSEVTGQVERRKKHPHWWPCNSNNNAQAADDADVGHANKRSGCVRRSRFSSAPTERYNPSAKDGRSLTFPPLKSWTFSKSDCKFGQVDSVSCLDLTSRSGFVNLNHSNKCPEINSEELDTEEESTERTSGQARTSKKKRDIFEKEGQTWQHQNADVIRSDHMNKCKTSVASRFRKAVSFRPVKDTQQGLPEQSGNTSESRSKYSKSDENPGKDEGSYSSGSEGKWDDNSDAPDMSSWSPSPEIDVMEFVDCASHTGSEISSNLFDRIGREDVEIHTSAPRRDRGGRDEKISTEQCHSNYDIAGSLSNSSQRADSDNGYRLDTKVNHQQANDADERNLTGSYDDPEEQKEPEHVTNTSPQQPELTSNGSSLVENQKAKGQVSFHIPSLLTASSEFDIGTYFLRTHSPEDFDLSRYRRSPGTHATYHSMGILGNNSEYDAGTRNEVRQSPYLFPDGFSQIPDQSRITNDPSPRQREHPSSAKDILPNVDSLRNSTATLAEVVSASVSALLDYDKSLSTSLRSEKSGLISSGNAEFISCSLQINSTDLENLGNPDVVQLTSGHEKKESQEAACREQEIAQATSESFKGQHEDKKSLPRNENDEVTSTLLHHGQVKASTDVASRLSQNSEATRLGDQMTDSFFCRAPSPVCLSQASRAELVPPSLLSSVENDKVRPVFQPVSHESGGARCSSIDHVSSDATLGNVSSLQEIYSRTLSNPNKCSIIEVPATNCKSDSDSRLTKVLSRCVQFSVPEDTRDLRTQHDQSKLSKKNNSGRNSEVTKSWSLVDVISASVQCESMVSVSDHTLNLSAVSSASCNNGAPRTLQDCQTEQRGKLFLSIPECYISGEPFTNISHRLGEKLKYLPPQRKRRNRLHGIFTTADEGQTSGDSRHNLTTNICHQSVWSKSSQGRTVCACTRCISCPDFLLHETGIETGRQGTPFPAVCADRPLKTSLSELFSLPVVKIHKVIEFSTAPLITMASKSLQKDWRSSHGNRAVTLVSKQGTSMSKNESLRDSTDSQQSLGKVMPFESEVRLHVTHVGTNTQTFAYSSESEDNHLQCADPFFMQNEGVRFHVHKESYDLNGLSQDNESITKAEVSLGSSQTLSSLDQISGLPEQYISYKNMENLVPLLALEHENEKPRSEGTSLVDASYHLQYERHCGTKIRANSKDSQKISLSAESFNCQGKVPVSFIREAVPIEEHSLRPVHKKLTDAVICPENSSILKCKVPVDRGSHLVTYQQSIINAVSLNEPVFTSLSRIRDSKSKSPLLLVQSLNVCKQTDSPAMLEVSTEIETHQADVAVSSPGLMDSTSASHSACVQSGSVAMMEEVEGPINPEIEWARLTEADTTFVKESDGATSHQPIKMPEQETPLLKDASIPVTDNEGDRIQEERLTQAHIYSRFVMQCLSSDQTSCPAYQSADTAMCYGDCNDQDKIGAALVHALESQSAQLLNLENAAKEAPVSEIANHQKTDELPLSPCTSESGARTHSSVKLRMPLRKTPCQHRRTESLSLGDEIMKKGTSLTVSKAASSEVTLFPDKYTRADFHQLLSLQFEHQQKYQLETQKLSTMTDSTCLAEEKHVRLELSKPDRRVPHKDRVLAPGQVRGLAVHGISDVRGWLASERPLRDEVADNQEKVGQLSEPKSDISLHPRNGQMRPRGRDSGDVPEQDDVFEDESHVMCKKPVVEVPAELVWSNRNLLACRARSLADKLQDGRRFSEGGDQKLPKDEIAPRIKDRSSRLSAMKIDENLVKQGLATERVRASHKLLEKTEGAEKIEDAEAVQKADAGQLYITGGLNDATIKHIFKTGQSFDTQDSSKEFSFPAHSEGKAAGSGRSGEESHKRALPDAGGRGTLHTNKLPQSKILPGTILTDGYYFRSKNLINIVVKPVNVHIDRDNLNITIQVHGQRNSSTVHLPPLSDRAPRIQKKPTRKRDPGGVMLPRMLTRNIIDLRAVNGPFNTALNHEQDQRYKRLYGKYRVL